VTTVFIDHLYLLPKDGGNDALTLLPQQAAEGPAPARSGPAQHEDRPMLFRVLREDYARHGSLANPAFAALAAYRFGRWALHRRHPAARWLACKCYGALNLFVANLTRVWIPPQVTIGADFHIIHAEGSLSIHPEAVLGDRVGVMHNVTIGTNMGPGAPVIGDDVFVGVNSTVLGPIRVGDRVRIAANTAVTTDVPDDSIVVGSPAKIYRRLTPFPGRRPAEAREARA
jgi:serine O-acetyltransferase